MSQSQILDKIIRQVRRRYWIVCAVQKCIKGIYLFAACYLVLLALVRGLGILPDFLGPVSFLAVPLLAIAFAAIFTKSISNKHAANLLDKSFDSHDIFLSAVTVDTFKGGYSDVVVSVAENKSKDVKAENAVPFVINRKLIWPLVAVISCWLLSLYVPQMDPFGKRDERRKLKEKNEWLEANAKQIDQKKAELAKRLKSSEEEKKEIDQKIEKMVRDLRAMKNEDKKLNQQRIDKKRSEFNREWTKLRSKGLAKALSEKNTNQRLGLRGNAEQEKWLKQLRKGELGGIRQEMADLRKMAAKLAKMAGGPDNAEKQKLREEMAKKLKSLSEFSKNNVSSEQLLQALKTAQQMLNRTGGQGEKADMQKAAQAMEAALAMAENEAGLMQNELKKLEGVENALTALQMARQLNQMNMLNQAMQQPGEKGEGEQGENGEGMQPGEAEAGMAQLMAEYEQLLAEAGKEAVAAQVEGMGEVLGQGQGEGQGEGQGGMGQGGMGGQGQGRGGIANEDDTVLTDFKSEKARSAFKAGKILMKWKTKGVSEPGTVKEDYVASVQDVKQRANEAIMNEEIPKGYHDAVKGYFDSIKAEE